MFCLRCGVQNDDNWKYCMACGNALTQINNQVPYAKFVSEDAIVNDEADNTAPTLANTEVEIPGIVGDFKKRYKEREKAERERLRKESEHVSFGKKRGGRDCDVDEVELAECMARFIIEYPLPSDKDSFADFYIYALTQSDEKNRIGEIYDTDEIVIQAWMGKVSQMEKTIDIRYSQDPKITKIQQVYSQQVSGKKKRFKWKLF